MKFDHACTRAITFGLGMMLCLKCSSAQLAPAAPNAPAAAAPAITLRVYDVRDLLMVVKDYPLGDGLVPPTRVGQMAKDLAAAQAELASLKSSGGLFAAPTSGETRQLTAIEQFKKVITDQIDPTNWKDNGGAVGSIESFNGRLFVTQTAQNQIAIENLLNELRKSQSVTVRIRADWVLLMPGQLNQLLKNGGEEKSALSEVNRDALAKLPENIVHYSGQLACFSGQTVHLTSGRARTTVTASTPIVASDAVAYQPTAEILQYGVSLQVTPTLSADAVTLDLLSIASDAGDPPRPTTQAVAPTMDRINALVQQFHTTVLMPLGKPVLVGGMTAEPTTNEPAGPQLYLIVETDAGN